MNRTIQEQLALERLARNAKPTSGRRYELRIEQETRITETKDLKDAAIGVIAILLIFAGLAMLPAIVG